MSSAARRCGAFSILVLVQLFLVSVARAHDPFELTTVVRVRENAFELLVTMTRACATSLLEAYDEPLAGALSDGATYDRGPLRAAPFEVLEPAMRQRAAALYSVSTGGRLLALQAARVSPSADNEVELLLAYPRPRATPGDLSLIATHLQRLGDGFGNAVTLILGDPPAAVQVEYLSVSDPVFVAPLPDEAGAPTSQAAEETAPVEGVLASGHAGVATKTSGLETMRSFLALGLEHIFFGYDHLLFLASVLFGCSSWRAMLTQVTAFSLAHSLTLALAALEWVVLPDGLVEPLIAASIIVVGFHNVMSWSNAHSRCLLTFAFGLVHGLGFAAALRGLGLNTATSSVLVPLVSFNVGVELGQLMLALPALPLLSRVRRTKHGPAIVRGASLLVIFAGAYWLVERL